MTILVGRVHVGVPTRYEDIWRKSSALNSNTTPTLALGIGFRPQTRWGPRPQMRSLCSLPSGVWKTVTFASFWECTPFLAWPIRLVGALRFGWWGKTGQILLARSRKSRLGYTIKDEGGATPRGLGRQAPEAVAPYVADAADPFLSWSNSCAGMTSSVKPQSKQTTTSWQT